MWELVFFGGIPYQDVKQMSFEEIYEAYEAMIMLEIVQEKK